MLLPLELYETAYNFWTYRNQGGLLLASLFKCGAELCPILPEKDDLDVGARFMRVRYTEKEKSKYKWIKKEKDLRRTRHLISKCTWTIAPVGIRMRKKSVQPKDQIFVYIVQMDLYDYEKGQNIKFISRVETDFLCKTVSRIPYYTETKQKDVFEYFRTKFPFPKRQVKKINAILFRKFFHSMLYAANPFVWHITDEKLYWYMGVRNHKFDPSYINSLLSLLRSPAGDASAVLLAYVCFSVMKRLFPQYHLLTEDAPHRMVQKYLPEQLALNIHSEQTGTAAELVELFCGCFRPGVGEKKHILLDGVDVLYTKKPLSKLGVKEYERGVIQPASPLWLNRRPENTLIESGRIFDLEIDPGTINILPDKSFDMDLLWDICSHLHDQMLESEGRIWRSNWEKSVPIIRQAVLDTKRLARRREYFVDFSPDDVGAGKIIKSLVEENDQEEHGQLRTLEDLMGEINSIESKYCHFLTKDWKKLRKETNRAAQEEAEKAELLLADIKSVFARCRKDVRKMCKINDSQCNFFAQWYQKDLDWIKQETQAYGIEENIVKKMAFLFTSASFFIHACVPEEERRFVSKKVKKGLSALYIDDIRRQNAKEMLDEYIRTLIKSGQCARIRGTDSENAKLFYVPDEGIFYLPVKTYFQDMLQSLAIKKSIYRNRNEFAEELEREGIIQVTRGGKYTRRSVQIKLRRHEGPLAECEQNKRGKNQDKESALKIYGQKLSKKFFEDPQVRSLLERLKQDKTSYRA